jgi:hypothetical protein
MNRWKLLLLFFACLAVRLPALTAFSTAELRAPPSSARLAEIERTAAASGWHDLAPPLRAAAFRAHELGSNFAGDWFLVSRWAEVFATTDDEFLPRWTDAIKAAHVDLANVPTNYPMDKRPLADEASPALQAWLLGHADFSGQFFSILSPCDLLPQSLAILSDLQARYPNKFPVYANLALAIAIVYDVPPPPNWPHAQVEAAVLPRRLPAPATAFAFWVHADETHQTLQPLSLLSAAELKFVVDAAAPAAELVWAENNISTPLEAFDQVYGMVRYRVDRVQQEQYVWPEDSYDLPTILGKGGICVDQAYFSSEVGKAKGVPTLLFTGAGREGWHAWFGYLDQGRHWQLDAGRYANQQLVTGFALDPQTWGLISDHELKFLSERFRLLPSWRQACVNADFAAAYLSLGQPAAAARAARAAVNYEPRHLDAWETLLAAQARLGAKPMDTENRLREMKFAFQNYPDIEAAIIHRIAQSLRARGQASAADFEERQFVHKVEPVRSDLNIDHDVEVMRQSMEHDLFIVQWSTYGALLKTSGQDSPIEFFERVVQPFVEHLEKEGHPKQALAAATRAKQALTIEPNSQLDIEMQALLARLSN